MQIGEKLKSARQKSGMTQEEVANSIHVSRQTISNWENEKSFPDIISVILLSDLYEISLDLLLKGDDEMIKHLDESTNIVKSNTKLLVAFGINIILAFIMIVFHLQIEHSKEIFIILILLIFACSATIFYQLIKKI